jgi:hypothetical protein
MRIPVTENGVTLPKEWFGEATEVEVRQENGHVSIEPVKFVRAPDQAIRPVPADDPLWKLFENASDLPIADASVNLDKHLCDFDS